MIPKLILGGNHKDNKGELNYNNSFNLSQTKRFYTIVNKDTSFKRRWLGHKIEQRWFAAISVRFEIELILLDNRNKPSADLKISNFELVNETVDVLHVPSGYISSIIKATNYVGL